MDFRTRGSYDFSAEVRALYARSVVVVVVGVTGCVDGFRGSNIQIDLSGTTPVQVSEGVTPGVGELPANVNLRVIGIDHTDAGDAVFELQRFELHRVIDLRSPCFIDVGENVRFPGLHVTQFGNAMAEATGITDVANPPPGASENDKIDAATAQQRMMNIALLGGSTGIKVVTSATETTYPAVDPDCGGLGLPPPECTSREDNARRLTICTQVWAGDPELYEGTDRVLTAPINGTTFGFVLGANPVTPVPVGGAQFFVADALETIDELGIAIHTDGTDDGGTLMLVGTPVDGPTRGVRRVHMESPLLPGGFNAEMAIFADLGEDDVHF